MNYERVIDIKCHANQQHIKGFEQDVWIIVGRNGLKDNNKPDGTAEPFRRCSYCGSMHPLDMLKFAYDSKLMDMTGSDWKYGWPHKFYLNVPNPDAGKMVNVGSYHGGADSLHKTETEMMAAHPGLTNWRKSNHGWKADRIAPDGPSVHAKFYSDHLSDLTPEEFSALSDLLLAHVQIDFRMQDGKLAYRAPSRGFQSLGFGDFWHAELWSKYGSLPPEQVIPVVAATVREKWDRNQ